MLRVSVPHEHDTQTRRKEEYGKEHRSIAEAAVHKEMGHVSPDITHEIATPFARPCNKEQVIGTREHVADDGQEGKDGKETEERTPAKAEILLAVRLFLFRKVGRKLCRACLGTCTRRLAGGACGGFLGSRHLFLVSI